jgi:RNA polymerase sigma-70 factor (ECF subfamily)
LYRVFGNDPELADLAQEVFAQAFVSVRRFRGEPSALEPWLVRVAVFTARATIRKRRSWRRLFRPSNSTEDVPGQPAATAEQRQELERVYAIFAQLPTDQRVILALHLMDQMSLTEISDAVSVSRSTVIRKLKRAQQRFSLLAEKDPVLRERVQRGQR